MRVLVTGSNGQLAKEIIRQIEEDGSPLGKAPEGFDKAQVVGVNKDALDITDELALPGFIEKGGFDVIFNCAAMTNVDLCETLREEAFRVNADAPGYIARAAGACGAKLVHISTDYVFSGDDPSPRRESDETYPKTVYGSSKLLGERRVLESGADAVIVRTAWLYGRSGKNFVKTMMSLARERGSVKVVDDQFGNPTNAADLTHHLLALAVSGENGVFHCTNNGICSWYDFALEIFRIAEIRTEAVPCTTAEFPRPAPRPAYSALDNARLRDTIGDGMREWKAAIYDYLTGDCR